MRLGRRAAKPRVQPLLARPGARFSCAGDGLCCTEIHGLGPLTRQEIRSVRSLTRGSGVDAVAYHPGTQAVCMRAGDGGTCLQREGSLCGLHRRFGAEAKPQGCRRFPFGLLRTPLGGRITTEHRCPCRTLGERPPLDVAEAERSLRGPDGRLEEDHSVPRSIGMAAGRSVPFERYQVVEQGLLDRLVAGARAEEVLGAHPFPTLHEGAWPTLIAEFYELNDGTACGEAMAWFADALLSLHLGHSPPTRPRPWAPAFLQARARIRHVEDPEAIFNDWLADELWMMRWLDWDCTFDVARAELATRLAAARRLVRRLVDTGVRPDLAAAEAVMISELGACNDHWTQIVGGIANSPSPLRAAAAHDSPEPGRVPTPSGG